MSARTHQRPRQSAEICGAREQIAAAASLGTNVNLAAAILAPAPTGHPPSRRAHGGPRSGGVRRVGRIVATTRQRTSPQCGQRSCSRCATRRRKSTTDSISAGGGSGTSSAARAAARPDFLRAADSAVVTDTLEATREHVQQKAVDKLNSRQTNDPLPATVRIGTNPQ